MVKGGICEDNDMCAGRWNVPQRHVVWGEIGGSVEARLVSVVRVHVTMVVITVVTVIIVVVVMCLLWW